jgi:hypothetical protein
VFVGQQGTQWEQTFWYPKVTIICMAWCSMPGCTGISETLTLQSSLMSMSTSCSLCLFHFLVDCDMADRQCPCFCL